MPWTNQGGGGPWGSGGGGKGPWGSGPQSPGGSTPPDLEEILRRGQDKLRRFLPGGNLGGRGFALLALAAIALWGFSGFFRVEPDELGVVLRFGKLGQGMLLITVFLLEWFYPVLFEVYRNGATPGKQALNLAVVQDDVLARSSSGRRYPFASSTKCEHLRGSRRG